MSVCLALNSANGGKNHTNRQTFRESFPWKFFNVSGKPESAFQKIWKAEEKYNQQNLAVLNSDGFVYPKSEKENCAVWSTQPHSAGAIVPYC